MKRIDDIQKIRQLKTEWDHLYSKCKTDNLFLTHTWICAWMSRFAKGEHSVLINRVDDQLTAAGIFRLQKRKASFISMDDSNWPNVLCLPEETSCFKPFLAYFLQTKNIEWIHLNSSPDDSVFQTALAEAASKNFYLIRHYPHCTRSIDVTDSIDAYLGSRPKKIRSELRRKQRKINAELPDIVFKVYDNPSQAEDVFCLLSQVEKNTWKQESGTAITCFEEQIGFYRDLFCIKDDDIKARAFFLMNGDTPLAYVIGLLYKETFYALRTSYKNDYEKLSPGQVIFYYLIEHFSGPNRIIDNIELLGADSRWKRELGSKEKRLCNIELLKKSPKTAGIYFAWHHILPFVEKTSAKYPKVGVAKEKVLGLVKRAF